MLAYKEATLKCPSFPFMEPKTRLQYLYNRYETGTCTRKERAELMELASMPEHEAFFKARIDAAMNDEAQDEATVLSLTDERAEELFEVIVQQTSPVRRISFIRRYWAAAAVLFVLAVGTYLWFAVSLHKSPQQSFVKEIAPGKEGAILTLADGSQISLDSIKNGVVALQGGVTAKVTNGTLIYEGKGSETVYNIINTPKGRQYQITLPDGTQVWLNAASSIRYPVTFNGRERKVDITGEAYFEVAKNTKMPFRVNIQNRAEVEVLGTHFNVNAYENEATINTTLLEGAVRVGDNHSEKLVLQPGQQAQVSQHTNAGEKTIRLQPVADLDKVMAWKNGLFNFKGVSLAEVLRQLERWYDIEVVYESRVPNIELSGKITREVTIQTLLEELHKMGLQYKMAGRKLIVL